MLVVGGIDIGNRLDISPRILTAINSFKVIVVENISNFNKLCHDLRIDPIAELIELYAPMDEAEETNTISQILKHLELGIDVLLLSDDGMPVMGDPGGNIIGMAHMKGIKVTVIPGPSIVSTFPSVLGVGSKGFTFLDDIPADRSERLRLFQKLYSEGRGVVFLVKNRRDQNANFAEVIRDINLVLPSYSTLGIGLNLTMPNELVIRTCVGEAYAQLDHYSFGQEDFISLYMDCRHEDPK
jgi:16S rRNA (cytidine1402-2'-O)-methyltransferase